MTHKAGNAKKVTKVAVGLLLLLSKLLNIYFFVCLLKVKPERIKQTTSAASLRIHGSTEDKTQAGSKDIGDVVLKDSVVSLAQEQLQQILNTVETNRNGPEEESKKSQCRNQ